MRVVLKGPKEIVEKLYSVISEEEGPLHVELKYSLHEEVIIKAEESDGSLSAIVLRGPHVNPELVVRVIRIWSNMSSSRPIQLASISRF